MVNEQFVHTLLMRRVLGAASSGARVSRMAGIAATWGIASSGTGIAATWGMTSRARGRWLTSGKDLYSDLLSNWKDEDFTHIERRIVQWRMARRPKRIILVRHAQSAGQLDEALFRSIPDNRIPVRFQLWFGLKISLIVVIDVDYKVG
jgi:hypothetical protein